MSEIFHLMARDEARHAGFLNKAMSDFNISLDLEKHPEYQFYPLFRMFESWCQDENRHGDIFKALLRSQPSMWNNWKAKLWARFFLLSVFATHTVTVHERGDFYKTVGLDPPEFF